jgi:Tol biopolymer transport system component
MAAVMGALEDEDERAPVGAEALQPQAVFVTPGPDVIRGTAEDDTIDGLAGNDRLFGLGGNDVIRGGRGDDIIRGGQGNDELYGGPGRDTIFGNAGNDVIYGGPGDDVLNGGAGRDQLFGENGNDVLRGGGGADLLDGGRGFNTLTGGAGPDTFRFSVPGGPADRITDFEVGVDKLDLRPILPDFQAGVDALRRFVRFESVENGTLINVRPSGEGEFTVLAGLEGVQVNRLPLADLGLAAPPGGGVDGRTIASTNAAGEVGNGASLAPNISTDGRFVTFSSSSTNFGANDSAVFDIYLKDLVTGDITRVSETNGVGGEAGSFFSAISADGTRVVFDSLADNFPGDVNFSTDQSDVFLADLTAGSLDFVSIANNRFATMPSISADGTRIAFRATATGRAETDVPAGEDTIMERIYVRNLNNDALIEASTSATGEFANASSVFSDFSANGRFVAFDSTADNLLPGEDLNPSYDVFVKDLRTGGIELANTTAEGAQGFGASRMPSISADGRFVAFHSEARLVDADFDQANDVYLKDMRSGEIQLVSTNANRVKGNGESLAASVSDDGRFVAFRSAATNLAPGDTNGVHDIFVKDMQTGQIARYEVEGDSSNVDRVVTLRPHLSGDGSTVAFTSDIRITGTGEIGAGQIVVAPVEFGTPAASLNVADVLSDGPAGGGGSGAGGGSALSTLSLESLLAPDTVI